MKNRYVALLLLAAMLLGTVACSQSTDDSATPPDDDTSVTSPATENEDGTTEEEEPEEEPVEEAETLDIEVKDYDGQTVNIVLAGNWEFNDFIAEELTGEGINDAVYETNSTVANLLNVNFHVDNQSGQTSSGTGSGYQLIDNMVMSGTHDYDFGEIGTYDVSTLAYTGKLLDLNEVNNIDLSKSWWDPKANDQLSIAGMMFYSTGDAVILDNTCTYVIMFNKEIVTNYHLDNPYELVNSSQWTYDKFIEMGNAVASDMNGDGIYDSEDAYGLLVWVDSVIGMLHASGGRFATVLEDGTIEMTLNSERNFDVLSSYVSARNSPMAAFLGSTMATDEAQAAFVEGRCLFYTRHMDAVSWFRELEADFGILPYPKWDETQADYCNTMHAYGNSFLCIPLTAADPDMSGAVLEALSYYGQQNITPAYYDSTLKGKYFRDDESGEMLDLIFSTRFFDVGTYYQIGGLNEVVNSMMREGNTDFASMWATYESLANSQLATINEAYREMINNKN